jgi:PKD repeat protein
MKKWFLVIPLALILALISIGCSAKSTVSQDAAYPPATTAAPTRTSAYPGFVPVPTVVVPSYAGSKDVYNGVQSGGGSVITVDRMVIRTGNIQLVVKDITVSLDDIVKIAAGNGGYVVTSNKWKESERNFGSISIRVMADNYDKAIASLRSLAISVTQESTSSQDVTEEYTDLGSNLKNLEATEGQLLKIMDTATKVEDVLAVQAQLTAVRGNIEQIKGRMLYLERTSSTSLININLTESVFGLKFSADKVRVNTNESVTFIPEITGGFSPFNYQWTFGDGEKSTEVSPMYSYKNGGDYTVVLTVTDDKGYTNQVVREQYINVQSSWNAGSVAGTAWNAVKVFAKVLANVLIWIVIFAPVWIIIGAIIWFCLYMKKKKARKAAEKKTQS